MFFFFFSSRRRHTRFSRDWSSDVCSSDLARFRVAAAKVPARRIPDAVAQLTALYLAERGAGEAAGPFFARRLDRARELLAPLDELRPEEARADDFVEPGASEPFRPATQEGECAA